MSRVPRTVIEFRDVGSEQNEPNHRFHILGRVYIDGNEVAAQKGGIKLHISEEEVMTVTLTLQPTQVLFTH